MRRRLATILLVLLSAGHLAGQDRRAALVSAIPGPKYPEVLQAAGISGTVSMRIALLPDGAPDTSGIRVLATSHPLFAKSAVEAVRGWRFRGAVVDGRAAPGPVLVDLVFDLGRGAGMHTFDRMALRVDSTAGPKWVVTSKVIDFSGRGERPPDSTWRRAGVRALVTILDALKPPLSERVVCVGFGPDDVRIALSSEERRLLARTAITVAAPGRCPPVAEAPVEIFVEEVGVWEGGWTKVRVGVGQGGSGTYHECLIGPEGEESAVECRARPAGWVS